MGRLLSIALFTMAPANIAVGWLADRAIARGRAALPIRVRLCVTGFLGAGLILLLNHVTGIASILPILVVSVCFFVVASANFWIIVQHLAPPDLTARTIAFFNTISQLAGIAAPIITGHTLGPANNFSLAILLAGGSTLCASILLLTIGTRAAYDAFAPSLGWLPLPDEQQNKSTFVRRERTLASVRGRTSRRSAVRSGQALLDAAASVIAVFRL